MPIGLVPALVMAGGSIGGAAIAAHASGKAANEQEQTAQQALGFQQQQFNAAQQQLAPYRQLGTMSLGSLYQMAGQPIVSPAPGGWGFTPRPMPPMGMGLPQPPMGPSAVPRAPMATLASVQPQV